MIRNLFLLAAIAAPTAVVADTLVVTTPAPDKRSMLVNTYARCRIDTVIVGAQASISARCASVATRYRATQPDIPGGSLVVDVAARGDSFSGCRLVAMDAKRTDVVCP